MPEQSERNGYKDGKSEGILKMFFITVGVDRILTMVEQLSYSLAALEI